MRAVLDLVEINFEQNPLAARWFASNDPLQILGELSLALGRDVVPGKNLLFHDEIQAGRAVIATLASCGGLLFLKVRNSTPTGKMWTEE